MTTLLMIAALAASPLPVTASPVKNTLLISAPALGLGSRYAEVVISVDGFPLVATRIASNQWLVQTDAPYGEFSAVRYDWGKRYSITSSWLRPAGGGLNASDLFVGAAFGFIVGVFMLHLLRNQLLW